MDASALKNLENTFVLVAVEIIDNLFSSEIENTQQISDYRMLEIKSIH